MLAARCCATRARAGRARTAPRALPAPPARRVPGHRPDPDRARRAARVGAIPTRAPRRWTELPSTRAACSSSATRSSRSTASAAPTSRTFLAARDTLRRRPAAAHPQLPHRRAVIDWVNHVFGELIQPRPRARSPSTYALEAASATRRRGPGRDAARRRAARATSPTPTSCASARPPTSPRRDPHRARRAVDRSRDGDGRRGGRPRLGDITILVPARTSLGSSRTRSTPPASRTGPRRSSLVYGTPRGPRPAHGAARRRRPHRRARARRRALRSPLFGCGDDDLFTYQVEHGGRWDHQPPLPETLPADHPVADAMRVPRRAARRRARGWRRASCSTASCARPAVLELGVAARPPRDLVAAGPVRGRPGPGVRRGRRRAACATTSPGRVRQGSEGARVVETVLPETDDDAVRIMTIHAAKGLEFPIMIVSGMSTTAAARPRRRAGALPARRRLRAPARARASRPRSSSCTTRSTSRWTSTSSSACSTSPAPRRATTSWSRCTARPASARRRVDRRGRTPSCCGTPRDGCERSPRSSRPRRRRRGRADVTGRAAAAIARRGQDERGRARSRAARAAGRRRDHAGSQPRRRRSHARRSRAGQGRPRPRAAAVEQGPLRHRDRPRGARGAADRRPRHRRRARRRRRRAGRGRRRARAGGDDRRARARRARRATTRRAASGRAAYWREIYVAVPSTA